MTPEATSPATSLRERAEHRRARERRALRGLGVVLLALVLVPALQADPPPGVSGGGLAVTLSLVALVASFTAIVVRAMHGEPGLPGTIALLVVLAASGTVLTGVQASGSGELTLTLVAWIAGARLPLRIAVALTATAAVALAIVIAATAPHPLTSILTTLLLAALLLLMARLFRRAEDERERAETAAEQLREAHARDAQAAALAERARIARELHDVLAHSLSGLALQLEGARLMAEREGVGADLQQSIDRSRRLAEDGLGEARRAVGALRGDDLPGVRDLDDLVRVWSADHAVPARLVVEGDARELPAEAGLALYRATQEALTNAVRHGHPARADVVLRYEAGRTSLVIADHRADGAPVGAGPLADAGSGYGLSAMRERAAQFGGTVQAGPTDDGFRVELEIPA